MKLNQRIMAMLLVICLTLPMFAYTANAAEPVITDSPDTGITIRNKDGSKEYVDESWINDYPYGVFALDNSELAVTEGGEQQVLTVYRLGGTANKASAVIYYQPSVVENEDGSLGYSSAISADDISIKVENPLPITEYQAWGIPPAPEETGIRIKSSAGVDGNGEPCSILSLDTEKEGIGKFKWYALKDGEWEKVILANGPELPVNEEELNIYDFRCEFELGGTSYCTDSYKKLEYEKPKDEEIPEAPNDIELNPAPTYTELDLTENGKYGNYNGMLFELCFADGEYKKDIIITAKDNSVAELDKYASFTIIDCVGGEVHQGMNTLLLRIADDDDDKAGPSQLAFMFEHILADKSDGTVEITVKRMGGTTRAISVDWSLEDADAKAGIDYVDNSGTLYFYGEQDEQTITVELINDKKEQTEKKEFIVRLTNLLGDDDSSISTEACIVSLYNTNTADTVNLASALADSAAIDVSSVLAEAPGAPVVAANITGAQVTKSGGLDSLSGERKTYVDWGIGAGGLDPLLYSYGTINFGDGPWGDTSTISMSIRSKGGNQTSKDLNSKLYKSLYARVEGGAELAHWFDRLWHGNEEYAYTYFSKGYWKFSNDIYNPIYYMTTARWTCSPQFSKSGSTVYLSAKNPFYVNDSWGYNDPTTQLVLGVDKFDSQESDEAINAKATVTLTRRTFDNDFTLNIYTANDSDIPGVAQYIEENYYGIIYDTRITEGGTRNGKLYEGSTVQVVLGNTHLEAQTAIIVDAKNNTVLNGSCNGKTVTFSNITLPPEGIYTLKLVLKRTQEINIDVTTSTELDSAGNPVGGTVSANEKAHNLLLSKNKKGGKVTVGYTATAGNLYNSNISEKDVSILAFNSSNNGVAKTESVDNIQWVNFNLNEKDVILFNGKAYAGNEKISLGLKDLTPKNLTFYFYEEEFLTAVRPMRATLDSTALYYDVNGNGKIDGYFDEASGVFVPDGDIFVAYMDDIDYEETNFRPVVDSNGKVHQYFMRPYYTANPVCLDIPFGGKETDRMQIMPNFITDVTDAGTYASLSEEQKQYRTIISGISKFKSENGDMKEGYTADNKLKYTAAASAYSYVDIPLGGDTSPARAVTAPDLGADTQNGKVTIGSIDYMLMDGLAYYYSATAPNNLGNAVYTWSPKYKGNLLYPFANPGPIIIENSLAGSRIPITKDVVEEKHADALNSYLGAYGGNDTFSLVINEQEKTTGDLIQGLDTLEDSIILQKIKETITRARTGTYPDSSYLKQNSGNGVGSDADSGGEGEYNEFSTDVESELFSFSSEMLSILSVETDGYEVSFSIGIPLYSKKSGEESGSIKNTFDDTKETAGKVRDFIKDIKNPPSGKNKKDAFSKLAGEDLAANSLKSKAVEFTVNVSLGITLKYNPLDNSYKFSEAALAAEVGIELRLQYRFTPVPIIYIYAQFGAEGSISSGFGQDRNAVVEKKVHTATNLMLYELPKLDKNEINEYYFLSDENTINIIFDGKVNVSCHEFNDENGNGEYDAGEAGNASLAGFINEEISSDGESVVKVKLKEKLEDGQVVAVRLKVMDDNNPEVNAKASISFLSLATEKQGVVTNVKGILPKEAITLGKAAETNKYFFTSNQKAFNITFWGHLYMECYEFEDANENGVYDAGEKLGSVLEGFTAGYIGSDGTSPTEIVLKALDKFKLDKPVVVFLSVKDGSSVMISSLEIINNVEQEFYWSGFKFEIEGSIELGVGVGVEIVKAELYAKASLGIAFKLGVHEGGGEYSAASFEELSLTAGLGFRIVALFFNYEMDLIEYHLNYEKGEGWTHGWSALGGMFGDDGDLGIQDRDDGKVHVYITPPSKLRAQVYSNNVNYEEGDVDDLAYNSNATEFQVSGYGSSVNAFRLLDNVETGYDYQIVTVGDKNYVVYTGTRTGASAVDGTQLMLAKLEETDDVYGFITPIPVDNDETGDLGFYTWAEGEKIHVIWVSYVNPGDDSGGEDIQNQIATASKNTEVKHTVFDTSDKEATGFADPEILSSGTGAYYFLPQAVGNAAVYARSVPYSEEDLTSRLEAYEKYLEDTMMKSGATDPEGYLQASKNYRLAYQQSILSVYGGNSMLTVTAPNGTKYANGEVYVSNHQEDGDGASENKTNEILTNIQLAQIDETYYLAYVTQEDIFEKDAGGEIYTDIKSISRLYLRSFTIVEDTEAAPDKKIEWGQPYLLRTIVNGEVDNTQDGIYSGGGLTKKYTDPYMANLSFLNGVIGDKLQGGDTAGFESFETLKSETFLLFEMNGNTYVIKEDSLKSIANGSHSGTIYPFFTYEQLYGNNYKDEGQNLSSGKSEVVIGTDGDGQIAAVYTGSVPNTVNNAVYISYWDPETSSWSAGVMLAMNCMDVYERSLAEGWDAVTTENAYFDEPVNGMTSFTFSNLQIALGRSKAVDGSSLSIMDTDGVTTITAGTAASINPGLLAALGLSESEDELESLGSSFSKAELYALKKQAELLGADVGSNTAASSELLILTHGLRQKLAKYESTSKEGEIIIAPKLKDNKMPEPSNMGVYAISYGKGEQQVGNATIRFSYNEFSVGSRLHAIVGFKNVGDAAIRGSENQPVVVQLMLKYANGGSSEMARWEIKQKIGAGQTVNLSTSESPCKPLASSLGEGDYFYITVSEDDGYIIGGAYKYDSSSTENIEKLSYKYKIENKPEMGIEGFKASVDGVEDNGDASVKLSFDVTNRGGEKAEEVFVQFSYIAEYDEAGNAVYKPLDITDSQLYVSQQKLIRDNLSPLGTDDLKNGIIYLGTDSRFYTDDYYITESQYNAILSKYYSKTSVAGWTRGTYDGVTYWYNQLYHISPYAAYIAGQEAVAGWSYDSSAYIYYNNSYSNYNAAKKAADEARRSEYIISEAAYNALSMEQKDFWKKDDAEKEYFIKAYASHTAAQEAFLSALSDDTQSITSNYCRTVKGTVNVSPDKFNGKITGSLDIRVEVFSGSSKAAQDIATRLYTSDHADEYYSENNAVTHQIEHASFISAAPKITLALGGTHRLPVSIRTTTGKTPGISAVEVEDGDDELSTLYYAADTVSSGSGGVASTETGAIFIVGNNIGEGVIHIIDRVTNTTYPITYRVVEAGDGINIYNDDTQFTFYNKDGTLYKEEELNQSWKFQTLPDWTEEKAEPYLRNISIGDAGASFSFETKASKVSFDMIGSATVSSNKFPGSFTVSNQGMTAPPTTEEVDFGNESSFSHTITVTATSDTAYFDILRLEYSADYSPSDDIYAPGIYWSRSFPTGASVADNNTAIEFTIYALDESGLQSISLNGNQLSGSAVTKISAGLWSHTFTVNKNGSFTVEAIDTNGNRTSRSVTVDWFTDSPQNPDYGNKPALNDATALKVKEGGSSVDVFKTDAVMTQTDKDSGYKIVLSATTDEGCELSYYWYNGETQSFSKMTSEEVSYNGIYIIRSDNANYQTWSAQIFYIDCFENMPVVMVTPKKLTSPNGYELEWLASKDEESTAKLDLASFTLNNIGLLSEQGTAMRYSGVVTVRYGGEYIFSVKDTKDVLGTTRVSLEVPIDISDNEAVSFVNPWSQPAGEGENRKVGKGSITVDFSRISGGDYTNDLTTGTPLDEYHGSYEAIILSGDRYKEQLLPDRLADDEDSWLTDIHWETFAHDKSHTWSNLEVEEGGTGKYLLIIRDKQNPRAYSTMAYEEIELKDNSINWVARSSRPASSSEADDGEIYASAAGGYGNIYEFAVLRLEKDEEISTESETFYKSRTADEFKEDSVKWQISDWDSENFRDVALKGIAAGKYQLAIRSLLTDDGSEKQHMTDLKTFGLKADETHRELKEIQDRFVAETVAIAESISDKSSAWLAASEKAAELKAAYEALKAKREAGDRSVTIEDVDTAYNAWETAETNEIAAEAAYIGSITGIGDAEKNKILNLRLAWLSETDAAKKHNAQETYETAVFEYCLLYWKSLEESVGESNGYKLNKAKEAYEAAQEDYDGKVKTLSELSADKYTRDSELWEGMLTSEELQVSVGYGSSTSLRVSPRNSSLSSPTGQIRVTAEGGTAYDGGERVNYQFAILPIESKASAVDYTANMVEIGNLNLNWQFADDLAAGYKDLAFTGLAEGWYQVFVRTVYDSDPRDDFDVNKMLFDPEDGTDLQTLRKAYEEAVEAASAKAINDKAYAAHALCLKYQSSEADEDYQAYLSAIDRNDYVIEKLNAWLNATEQEEIKTSYEDYWAALSNYFKTSADEVLEEATRVYNLKLSQIEGDVEKAYINKPGNYDTASFTTVYVGIEYAGITYVDPDEGSFGEGDVSYEDDEVTYNLREDSELLPAESEQIFNDNSMLKVRLIIGKRRIVIPAGVLKDAGELNNLLKNFVGGSGNIIEYTDPTGKTRILPISFIENENAAHLYMGEGSYKVGTNAVFFRDIAGHWAEASVAFAAGHELFSGIGDNLFNPGGNMTRAMLAAVLYRMMGSPDLSGSNPFDDVDKGTWYSDAVNWAYENGIIKGVSESLFAPNGPVTRAEMVTMLYRFLTTAGFGASESGELDRYPDGVDVPSFSVEGFSWAVAAGIIVGNDKGMLSPANNASRAEVAAVFERIIRYILK